MSLCKTELFEIELFIYIKLDLALITQNGWCVKKHKPNQHTHTHYIYIYICVCVCVCVYINIVFDKISYKGLKYFKILKKDDPLFRWLLFRESCQWQQNLHWRKVTWDMCLSGEVGYIYQNTCIQTATVSSHVFTILKRYWNIFRI